MNRKDFLKFSAIVAGAAVTVGFKNETSLEKASTNAGKPLAITMWDFSWLERRWPGGSYEDWDKVLDELVDRGYNAVRIDAYPHLIAADPEKEWTLIPVWDQYDWGSPGIIKVQIQPSLTQFISKCKNRNIKVGLSTWYREDADNTRMLIDSPEKMAANWLKVLDIIANENLLDTILYVDMCNEWPHILWTPFFKAERIEHNWSTKASMDWMQRAIEVMVSMYPELPYTFSFDHYQEGILKANTIPFLDFIEQHIWMVSLNKGEFNNKVGIDWNGFSTDDIKRLVKKSEALYRSNPVYWNDLLTSCIKQFANDAKAANKPLITTECWSIVNYKDFPMLNWNWVKDTCALGVKTAAATGQWVALSTSNFCGPQFVGMWQDVEWHRMMTDIIKKSTISEDLKTTKIMNRL